MNAARADPKTGAARHDALIAAVYDTVVDPAAWSVVVQRIAAAFPSSAQTFYFLDRDTRRVRPVALRGIDLGLLRDFDALYFAADNPWIRLTQRLHQPGVVRTNERLAAILHDDDALYRSAYYHDWMKPQRFRFTLGTTLLADEHQVANVTLMRPPDMPSFDAAEVAAFERIGRHLTHALALAARLQQAAPLGAGLAALDGWRHGLALVDAALHVVHANAAMEQLLRESSALTARAGRLGAVDAEDHRRLADGVAAALDPQAAAPQPLWLRLPCGGTLTVTAAPACRGLAGPLPQRPLVLLTVADSRLHPDLPQGWLRRRWNLTAAEARLVERLAGARGLRDAARAAGVSYETARTTLKAVFTKAGVRSQQQLLAQVMRELPH